MDQITVATSIFHIVYIRQWFVKVRSIGGKLTGLKLTEATSTMETAEIKNTAKH